jgi:hypothetical protein
MGSRPACAEREPSKQHRRPRFSSTHNVKHPRTNWPRTNSPQPAYPPHPSRSLDRPVCDEARGISRGPLPRQQPFRAFFSDPKIAAFERQLMPRAHCGARAGPAVVVREVGIYTRPVRRSRSFSFKIRKSRVFHRSRFAPGASASDAQIGPVFRGF